MAGLAAVLFASDNAFCILYGNAAFSLVHKNDKSDKQNEDNDKCRNEEVIFYFAESEVVPKSGYKIGTTGNNTGKEDHGNAVSDTLFIDSFAKPHNEHGTGGEHEEDSYNNKYIFPGVVKSFNCVVTFEGYVICICLDQSKSNG